LPPPKRRSPRLAQFDYASSGAYFVTVCVLGKRCVFGIVEDDRMILNRLGREVEDALVDAPRHWDGVALDRFVVMPNHVHATIWLGGTRAGQAPPLHQVVGGFKAQASRLAGERLWQRSFNDRVIRDERELEAFRRYIAENPLRWALDRENPVR
jgi:REP element-mobilizing transposase RayT